MGNKSHERLRADKDENGGRRRCNALAMSRNSVEASGHGDTAAWRFSFLLPVRRTLIAYLGNRRHERLLVNEDENWRLYRHGLSMTDFVSDRLISLCRC